MVYFKFHKGGRMTQNEETIKNDGLETEMDPPEKKKGRPKKVNTEDTTESTLPEDENQTDGISEQAEQVEGNQNTETAEDEHIVGLEEDIEDINDSEEDSVEDTEDGEINPTVDEIAKAIATIFDKRRVFAANKKEKRKLYGRKEKVVSERGASAKTEKDYLKEEYEILKAAVRSYPKKLILKGVITGVVEDSTTGQMSAQVKADNTRGLFKILIPVQELFPIRLEDYRGERGVEYLKNEMISRINGEIEFTVYDLHEAERYAKGSRVEALAIKTSRYYFNLQNDGKPEMVEGVKALAKVVSVRKDRVKVEVCGAETTIISKELSWLALGVITDEFSINDQFYVRVSNIKEYRYDRLDGAACRLVTISASKRDAEPKPAEQYYDSFELGGYYGGVIKNADDEAGVFVNLQEKMDCLCGYPASGIPSRGKQCIVQITRKEDAKKRLSGNIVSM